MSVPATAALRLGAPGIVRVPARPRETLRPERLDVAGFVGVAPRGPVDTPVAVTSWSQYQERFGTPRGPTDGLLGHAVHAFFAQGGQRALVLRVSPLPRDPAPAARAARAEHELALPAPVTVHARDEGTWGDGLTVRCAFDDTVRFPARRDPDDGPADLVVPAGVDVPAGSLLAVGGTLRRVLATAVVTGPADRRRVVATLEPGPPVSGSVGGPVGEAAVVTATITVDDPAPDVHRGERFTGLGLFPEHPRWAGAAVGAGSRLVVPGEDWARGLRPDGHLAPVTSSLRRAGRDRWADIGPASFAGDRPVTDLPTDPADLTDPATAPVHGLDRMALEPELGLLAAPDLLVAHREPDLVVAHRPTPPGDDCAPAEPALAVRVPGRIDLLDAGTELDEILTRQRRLVELAERARRFVALLDAPRGAATPRVTRWRAGFDSSYAAGYHPWLGVLDPLDPGAPVVSVPPCGFAAGIIAEREHRLGLPWGPANVVAAGAVSAATTVSDADHAELHHLGVDVFRAERDGFRLTSARTLSSHPEYRQLSVRRLMTMLALTLERRIRWLVFEPNTAGLRAGLVDTVTALLRDLQRAGAFAGATEAESFSVSCDDVPEPGRVVAEIRVCPSVPLEYLLVRVVQDADGAVSVSVPGERGSEP